MNINSGSMRAQQQSNLGNVHIKQSQEVLDRVAQSDDESKVASKDKGVKVSISMAGLKKQSDEVNATEKKDKGTAIDRAIAKLKEQIEHIKEQLEAVQGDSPEAEEQRKMLQQQLGILNASLLSAIDKKTKQQQEQQQAQQQ